MLQLCSTEMTHHASLQIPGPKLPPSQTQLLTPEQAKGLGARLAMQEVEEFVPKFLEAMFLKHLSTPRSAR